MAMLNNQMVITGNSCFIQFHPCTAIIQAFLGTLTIRAYWACACAQKKLNPDSETIGGGTFACYKVVLTCVNHQQCTAQLIRTQHIISNNGVPRNGVRPP